LAAGMSLSVWRRRRVGILIPPLWSTILLSEIGGNLHGALHIALEDKRQILTPACLNLFRKFLQSETREALGKLRLALLHLAVLRDGLALSRSATTRKLSARHPACLPDPGSRRSRWALPRRWPARDRQTWREPWRRCLPTMKAVAVAQLAFLHQHAGHKHRARSSLASSTVPRTGAIRRRLQVAKIGGEADHFEQQIEVLPLLRRDIDKDGRNQPHCLRHQPRESPNCCFTAIRLRFRLIDLVPPPRSFGHIAAFAWSMASSVCGITRHPLQTTITTISVTWRRAHASVKASWPGVSRKTISRPNAGESCLAMRTLYAPICCVCHPPRLRHVRFADPSSKRGLAVIEWP